MVKRSNGSKGKVSASKRKYFRSKGNFTYPSFAAKRTISGVSGPGTRLKSKFTYSDRLSLAGGVAGAASTYVFRINSLFDPDFAFGGHQPAGYDELMAIYEHYVVTEVDYKIYLNNGSATNPMLVGVSVADNSTTSIDFRTYVENGASQVRVIAGTDGGGVTTLSGRVNIADLMGVSQTTILKDDSFWGTQSTNPSDQAYLKFFTAETGTQTGETIQFIVELNFTAHLMGGRFLTLS